MTPTIETYEHYRKAAVMSEMASFCLRCELYGQASEFANRAAEYWRKVQWQD